MRIDMKKIIFIVVIPLFLIGCSSSIQQCIDDYPNNDKALGACVHQITDGKTNASATTTTTDGKTDASVTTTSTTTDGKTDASVTTTSTTTDGKTDASVITTSTTTDGKTDASATTSTTTDDKIDVSVTTTTTDGKTDASAITSTTDGKTDASATIREDIASNLNTMCDDLKKNFDKFNNSHSDSRIINKARREYDECITKQADLKTYQ